MLRRVLRLLLRLIPSDVRGDLGQDIEETFVDEAREAHGVVGKVGLWLRNAVGFARLGLPIYLDQIAQDARYGIRALRATPLFTLLALVALASGVGAAASTFAISDAMLLKPLPFADPDQLVHVWSTDHAQGREVRVSLPEVEAWARETTVLDGLALFNYTSEDLTGGRDPERVPSARVSANIFEVLGVRPERGRAFVAGEDAPGAAPVVIISHRFWQQRFGAREDVLDQTVEIGGTRQRVVGVVPASFVFPLPVTDLWMPRTLDRARYGPDARVFQVVARLRPGTGLGDAQRALSAASSAAVHDSPALDGRGVNVVPLREALNVAYDIFAIGAMVVGVADVIVLLTACANISSLMLSRAIRRGREAALRAAIGASRGRLVRQYLVESLILALGGGALGALLASWGLAVADRAIPGDIYRVAPFTVDARVLGVAFLLSAAAALAFGLVPALRLSRVNLAEAMRQDGGTGTASRQSLRLQSGLVVKQVALTVVLLVAAVLTGRSFAALSRVDPGFQPDGVLSVQTILARHRYPSNDQIEAFVRGAEARVRALPGVRRAAFVDYLPLNHETTVRVFGPPGLDLKDKGSPTADVLVVSPDYFSTIGIPLRQGRDFDDHDRSGSEPVVVINESMASRYWPAGALGAMVQLERADVLHRIVGVVADTLQTDLAESGRPQIFLAQAQHFGTYWRMLIRGDGDPRALIDPIAAALHAVDPQLALTEVRPLSDVVNEFLLPQRGLSAVLLVLGALSFALALFGIYGIVACFVTERTREMGIRIAVGADARLIVRYVLGRGLRLTVGGIAVGVPVAAMLAYALRGLLYGVNAADPMMYLLVAALIASVAAGASYLPARRAARISPLVALRTE